MTPSSPMENVTSGEGKQNISQWSIRPATERLKRRASWCWGKSGHWMNKSLKIKYCSGFWGLSRHLNYVFELMLALTWSLPSLGNNAPLGLARISPFFYFFFLLILLVHRYRAVRQVIRHFSCLFRTFRDEEKCRGKYGEGYEKYCQEVPYRMIPWVF